MFITYQNGTEAADVSLCIMIIN